MHCLFTIVRCKSAIYYSVHSPKSWDFIDKRLGTIKDLAKQKVSGYIRHRLQRLPLQWVSGAVVSKPTLGKVYPSIDIISSFVRCKDSSGCRVRSRYTVRREQTELGTFFSILYLSPSKERRSVELLDLLYFMKRFHWEFLFTLQRSDSQDYLSYWFEIRR